MNYLHSEKVAICHRDINPNNVMVTQGDSGELEVTLIDFNVSKRFRDEDTCMKLLMLTNTGAAAFIAPEVHNQ